MDVGSQYTWAELVFIHPLWRRKESEGEEEGNENRALTF